MTADLLVIIPSRGRPEAIADLWECWKATADGCAQLLVCLDEDDRTQFDYPWTDEITFTLGMRNGFAPRLSDEASHMAPHYFALASWGDDHRPRTPGWDTALVEALGALGTGFAYGDDGFQHEELPTACAMTSDIVQTLGWMTPPGLEHLFVDRFWRDAGEELDRITYLPEVSIEHMHPAAGKADWDPLWTEANAPDRYAQDGEAYEFYKLTQMDEDLDKLRVLL